MASSSSAPAPAPAPAPPLLNCKKCGSPATSRCSRCRTASYCSRECQRDDWKRHRREECTGSSRAAGVGGGNNNSNNINNNDESLLPADFLPQSYLRCLHCGKHYMMCECTGLGHAKSLLYVMDEPASIPAHYTVLQRIKRWALLVKLHPRFQRLDAERFVADLPASFPQDLELCRPVFQKLMDGFVNGTGAQSLTDTRQKLGIVSPEGKEQCERDCAYAIEHFFKGNWSYPTVLEFIFLNNAVQMSGPEDFDAATSARIRVVFSAVEVILAGFEAAGEGSNFNYRLEDVSNVQD